MGNTFLISSCIVKRKYVWSYADNTPTMVRYSFVNRSSSDQPDKEGRFLESRAPFDASDKEMHVTILVDKTSVEVFVDDGRIVQTDLVFPRTWDRGISLFSEEGIGTTRFRNVKLERFDS
ncbi:GH32 C-terminal domain-containing protein [Rossellomorea aquimaris]|uniref:GH32 C-terminal domain-containing protein n=1 Tax=Rossellomorea aquimaris TaxID=189382 RepID=UPI0037C9F1CB